MVRTRPFATLSFTEKKDRKLYDDTTQELISDIFKSEKLNEDPTLKHEASLQCLLRKLKLKNFFNENE